MAQVQMTLEDVGDTSSLAGKADLLKLELAAEFARSARMPVHGIRDMTGSPGKVTLTFGSEPGGEILVGCFVDVPPGGELRDMEKVAHGSTHRKLLTALRTETGPGAEMKVQVAVVPESQCFVLGTRYTPDLNAEQAAVSTAKACQVTCTQTLCCSRTSCLVRACMANHCSPGFENS